MSIRGNGMKLILGPDYSRLLSQIWTWRIKVDINKKRKYLMLCEPTLGPTIPKYEYVSQEKNAGIRQIINDDMNFIKFFFYSVVLQASRITLMHYFDTHTHHHNITSQFHH